MSEGLNKQPRVGSWKRRLGVAAVVLACAYVVGFHWPAGGLRTAFGFYSGSRVPAEARAMTQQQREDETLARAERIRLAALAFLADTGAAPTSVVSLVPKYLPEVPRPLVSTKPFWFGRHAKAGGFNVHWEAWPNANYETYWLDERGERFADM
jgi:hypothetical protein